MAHKESESEPSFKLRSSDIISVIGVLVIVAGIVASNAVMGEKINTCIEWQRTYKDLPACVESNKIWIERNKDLPSTVLTNQLDLRYVGKEMQKLTDQLEAVNKNLTWFKNYRRGSVENNDRN